jgi:hypothetical protein
LLIILHYCRGAYSRLGPHWQSIGYHNFDQAMIEFSIMLGLNLDWGGTDSAMTRVLVLSAKVRRNEWLKWAVMAYSRHW